MKISLEWLSEFITWKEHDPLVIADRLTLSTAEVEEVMQQGALLEHCCVGKVTKVEKHPDADRLSVAEVETDKGKKTVVCGGTNVAEGMLVAFAHVGATVKWHGGELMTLEPVKIRGVASAGMICAAEELGLEALFKPTKEDGERPIIDLSRLSTINHKLSTGKSLKEALQLNDTILDINNTAITTRPDLFSHVGIAREYVALGLATWKKEKKDKKPSFPKTKSDVQLSITDKKLAPRYLACMLSIESLGETPDWMRKRLEATGWRCVNLPVDITNYVAMEIGVPLHSFDADDIKGTVKLRLSKKGEKITTLDEEERELPDGALVLSDDEGIFDLLGIMGGLRSSTKPTTKKIYLHSASLDPVAVRRGIIGTGHRTDAATVYEKGVPPITAERGFYRALELFLELVPGAKVISALESEGTNGKPNAIDLSLEEINATLGTELKEKEVANILESLEFEVKKGKAPKSARSSDKKFSILNSQFSIIPPLHRLRDITGAHDVIEEIGRIHGFDSIETVMPTAPVQLPERDNRIHRIRTALKEHGFSELVPLSFVSPLLLKKTGLPTENAVAIANPLGEETSLLQTSTLPALLQHAHMTLPQVSRDLLTFQWGHVFHKSKPEHLELGALYTAKEETDLLHDPFLQLKQGVLRALQTSGYIPEIAPAKDVPPYAHPGRTGAILVQGKQVGHICEVHPTVRTAFDLPFRSAAATLDLSALFALPAAIPMAKPVPAFPAITYDETIARTHDKPLGALLKNVRGASTLLEDVSVHDLYAKQHEDSYQLTLRFVYRSPEKTLTEAEVKKEHEKILKLIG